MYIKRLLEDKIKEYLNYKEIIALIGPRQSGKTTLLKRIFKNLRSAVYLSFDDQETLSLFLNDIKAFAQLYLTDNKYIFIDEFQYAKNGGKYLKFLYDHYPQNKIIISGSSALDLSLQAVKYLVGRVFILKLFPLNFEEFLSFKDENFYKNIYLLLKSKINFNTLSFKQVKINKVLIEKCNKYYNEYLRYGGYPRVVIAKNEKHDVLKNIYNTYLLREIKDILGFKNDYKLIKLIKLLSLQMGNIINFNDICKNLNITFYELKNYLNVFEKTFILRMVNPFYTNKSLEIIKNPKLYFIDNGFRNIIINDLRELEDRMDQGALNENFVFTELYKKDLEIKYWRTKSKAEVDFVLEQSNGILPIEVKSNNIKQLRSFISFIEKYNPKNAIITNNFEIDIKKINKTQTFFYPNWFISV